MKNFFALLGLVYLISCVGLCVGCCGFEEPLKDTDDKYVKGAIQFVMQEINRRSNSVNKAVMVEITKGTVQVVAGLRYRLTLSVGLSSNCPNDGKPATVDDCPVDQSTLQDWYADIWMKPKYPVEYELMKLELIM